VRSMISTRPWFLQDNSMIWRKAGKCFLLSFRRKAGIQDKQMFLDPGDPDPTKAGGRGDGP